MSERMMNWPPLKRYRERNLWPSLDTKQMVKERAESSDQQVRLQKWNRKKETFSVIPKKKITIVFTAALAGAGAVEITSVDVVWLTRAPLKRRD